MKRVICFILVLLMLTPVALAAEDKMVFRLESASGQVGDTVTVTGLVENAPVCASFRVILTYDSTVLEPVEAKKLECSGLFMKNTAYTYQGKPAINVLSADANKSLEGNMKLFSVTFKIIAESPESNGSPITVAHHEFFDPSTPKPQSVYPVIEEGRIYVGDDQPGASSTPDDTTGSTTTPDDTTTGDTTTDNTTQNDTVTGDTTTDNTTPDDTTTGGETADGESEEPSTETEEATKKPTGSWITDPETEDIYHVDEDGNTTVFEPEYSETPEPGKVTDVVLKDKETGEEVGSIKVEGKEDGTFEVIEQDVPSLEKDDPDTGDNTGKKPISIWVWIGVGGGVVLVAAAVAAWYFLLYRKKVQD